MEHKTDLSRITVLQARDRRDSDPQWKNVEPGFEKIRAYETIAARLLRRALDLLPVTLRNIVVFKRVAAKTLGPQRRGPGPRCQSRPTAGAACRGRTPGHDRCVAR